MVVFRNAWDFGLWFYCLGGGCTSSRLRVAYVLCISAGVWFVWSQNGQAVTNSAASAASLEGFQAVIKSAASAVSPGPKFVEK